MHIIRNIRGLTLIEVMITTVAFGIVLAVLNTLFFSSNTLFRQTNQRAGLQQSSRMGMAIMARELRHAGCDPGELGIAGVVMADTDGVRVRGDMNGDFAIQTTEPSEDVTYTFDADARTLFRNPGSGAQPIMRNVSSITFTYLDGAGNPLGPLPLDAANLTRVRSVRVALTGGEGDLRDVEMTTTITLRNM